MGSVFKVEVKDFQSLKHIKLDLENGVTVITGRSNQGKTAVIRAIDSAIFNLGDDSMVRGGKRYAVVSLDNGSHKMIFCRDNNGKNEKTAYQFDGGAVQKKVGRTQLSEVSDMFNIRDVRMQNNTKMKLNFWYQNDKPFLMDKTSGQLYEFLSLSSCDSYTRVLKQMVVDMKIQEAEINNITTEIDTLKLINNKKQSFVDDNVGFSDLYVKIVTAGQEETKLKEISAVFARMEACKEKIDIATKGLNKSKKVLASIPVDKFAMLYNSMAHEYTDLSDIASSIKALSTTAIRKGATETAYNTCVANLVTATNKRDLFKASFESVLEENKKVLDIANVLSSTLTKQKKLQTSKALLAKAQSSKLFGVDLSKYLLTFDKLKQEKSYLDGLGVGLVKLDKTSNNVSLVKVSLGSVASKLANCNKELEDLKAEAGFCPFCGTVFTK